MGTRFGRRAADGTFEYHDNKESLVAAERRDSSDARSGLFGLIRPLVGGVLTYIVLIKVGTEWPKWLRFGLVIAGAGGLAYILAKFADLIWNIILSLVLLAVWGASARGFGKRCRSSARVKRAAPHRGRWNCAVAARSGRGSGGRGRDDRAQLSPQPARALHLVTTRQPQRHVSAGRPAN